VGRRKLVNPGAKRVTALVGSLSVPIPWNLHAFTSSIAEQRGKPIRLVPHPGLSGSGHPCGVWIGREHDDIVVYDVTTSSYHAEQIVLHELGHLLLRHGAGSWGGLGSIQALVPDIDPATVSQVMTRTHYGNEEEWQAELFASLVMSESHKTSLRTRYSSAFFRV
jgi:hypothetical protein